MAIWRYEAADASGKVMRGAMDAPTSQDVVRRLTEKGYHQVNIAGQSAATATSTQARAASTSSASSAAYTGVNNVPQPQGVVVGGAAGYEDLGLFFRQMSSLMHAGFTPSAALADLGQRTSHRGLASAAREMAQNVSNGASMAQQMARFPALFAPHQIGLVAAGEAGGFLPFSFEEAALGAEQDAALKKGMWLPKFLFWQSIWSVLLFAPFFPTLDLKAMEGGFGGLGKAFSGYLRAVFLIGIPLGIGMHVTAYILGWIRPQPFARAFFDKLSLYIPVMRRLATMRALASAGILYPRIAPPAACGYIPGACVYRCGECRSQCGPARTAQLRHSCYSRGQRSGCGDSGDGRNEPRSTTDADNRSKDGAVAGNAGSGNRVLSGRGGTRHGRCTRRTEASRVYGDAAFLRLCAYRCDTRLYDDGL